MYLYIYIYLKERRGTMEEGEYEYLLHWIGSKKVPTPRLLIKDHKKPMEDGGYPTRLLVPATNFTQGFANLAYRGIKHTLDSNGVVYYQRKISQTSHLKDQLEELSLNSNDATLVSLDIKNMYPSLKYKLILAAITHYSHGFDEKDNERINACLEMLKFSMSNTIVTFRDRYYKNGVHGDPMERSLTIGGYKSGWLADLIASFIFEKAQQQFEDTHFFGIYRDDGLAAFKGRKETSELTEWLQNFQSQVNIITQSEDVQFTMVIWKPGEETREMEAGKVEVCGDKTLPYLDTQLGWDEEQTLCFECYSKPNFQFKYLNQSSVHTPTCKRAIPHGVGIRMAGLTRKTEENEVKSLSELYPENHKALVAAGLVKASQQLPSLAKVLDDRAKNSEAKQLQKEKRKKDKRTTYILTRFSGNWRYSIHKTINLLKTKYGMK